AALLTRSSARSKWSKPSSKGELNSDRRDIDCLLDQSETRRQARIWRRPQELSRAHMGRARRLVKEITCQLYVKPTKEQSRVPGFRGSSALGCFRLDGRHLIWWLEGRKGPGRHTPMSRRFQWRLLVPLALCAVVTLAPTLADARAGSSSSSPGSSMGSRGSR